MASRKEQKERLRAERLARESEDQAKERRRRLVQYGSAAAFLAICAVAALIIISQSGGDSAGGGTKGATEVNKQLQGIPQHSTVLGDPKAKVSVVEFGDLQCPACEQFSTDTAPGLISGPVSKGDVNYEFRQYLIIGPDSKTAAEAALAAGEQNRYWNYIELFYRNQGVENSGYVTDNFLESVAKGAGVPDIEKWNNDRQDPKWDKVLKNVQTEAQTLGFNSTPSFLVEGPGGKNTASGVLPLSEMESLIKSVQ
jgi:protein-disulfide isomerase